MVETRLPCPVCLGVKMKKELPDQRRTLTLDLCPRCGGMWFEAGEVQAFRAGSRYVDPDPAGGTPHRGRCHACHATVDRDAEKCPACGHPNRIDCPQCGVRLGRIAHGDRVLDVCAKCKGIWFDRHEIGAIWTLALTTALQRQGGGSPWAAVDLVDGAASLLEVLSYTPDVGTAMVEGSVHAISGLVDVLSAAPELAGAFADAAGAVFEILVHIVAAILDGLSL